LHASSTAATSLWPCGGACLQAGGALGGGALQRGRLLQPLTQRVNIALDGRRLELRARAVRPAPHTP